MPFNEDPKEIDHLPNPKWSKRSMDLYPRRALFPWWVWPVAILAAVLTFVIVWFGFVAPSLRAGQAVAPTSTPTATPTVALPTGLPPVPPTSEPTAAPTDTPEPTRAPSGAIVVGGKVRVTGTGAARLNVRQAPGTTAAVVTRVGDGHVFTVLEGPQAADGYQWWKVQDDQGTVGWVAANWLEPIP